VEIAPLPALAWRNATAPAVVAGGELLGLITAADLAPGPGRQGGPECLPERTLNLRFNLFGHF